MAEVMEIKNRELFLHLRKESAGKITNIVAATEILYSYIVKKLSLENVSDNIQNNLNEKLRNFINTMRKKWAAANTNKLIRQFQR